MAKKGNAAFVMVAAFIVSAWAGAFVYDTAQQATAATLGIEAFMLALAICLFVVAVCL